MTTHSIRALLFIATLAWLLGCGERLGVLGIGDGVSAAARKDTTVEFGGVLMGTTAQKSLVVSNSGQGPLTLASLSVVDGDPVQFGPGAAPNAVWRVSFEPGTVLRPGEQLELEVFFHPPVVDVPSERHRAVLSLLAEDVAADSAVATVTLVGTGMSSDCAPLSPLDFGGVKIQQIAREALVLTNSTLEPVTARLGAVSSGNSDYKAFILDPAQPREFVIQPGASQSVIVSFKPTEWKEYTAELEFSRSEFCGTQQVALRGSGVYSVLTWEPLQIDCGYATPGAQVTRELTFTNAGNAPVELGAIKTSNTSEFGVLGPGSLTVPARSAATLTVWCKPEVLGSRQAQLTFSTNLSGQSAGSVMLKAYGGGPDIELRPFPTLNFGRVAYFANAPVPAFLKRQLVVANVGTQPNPLVTLKIGQTDASGNVIPDSYFAVTPLNAETAPDEFTVEMPAGYDPQRGIDAAPGSNTAILLVRVTPKSLGLKQAEITLYSNDPDESEVKLTVLADATEFPPCNYSVSAATLDFGVLPSSKYRDLGFSITNMGTNPGDVCLLSGLDLLPGTDAVYSLLVRPVEGLELAPSTSVQVVVRAWAQGQAPATLTTLTGAVEFYVSSPVQPDRDVVLRAAVGSACLMIAPDELDFGTVVPGCSSATQTFSAYNTCTSTLKLNSFRILSAPSFDPSCLSTSSCEFLLTSSSPIPTGGLPLTVGGAPATFDVKYRPQDLSADADAVLISANLGGANVTYLVPLRATTNAQGVHTDTFWLDVPPKADVLLVVDNSASMSAYLPMLVSNVVSLLKYADSVHVDYHLAVIHNDPMNSGYRKLIVGPGHPEAVLTPTTVDLHNKLKSKVNVGTSGSGGEYDADAALGALTPPLVNGDNAGFLRSGASLAVVVFSDEPDQSPLSTAYYLGGFWNLKGFNRKSAFTFNVVTSGPGCLVPQPASEYVFYTSQTAGVLENLCTTNWSAMLERVGETAFGFRTRYFLTSTPDLAQAPLDVKVDGTSVPSTTPSGATIWTYDPATNSVNFDPMYVPIPGQTLTIAYIPACYP